MADVTGPIASLPGTRRTPPEGTKCDEHEDRLAVARIQGETDSFGCEMIDMCEECLAQFEAQRDQDKNPGPCEWCKQSVEERVKARDPEEGLFGPVYDVCPPCVSQKNRDFIGDAGDDDEDWPDVADEYLPDLDD